MLKEKNLQSSLNTLKPSQFSCTKHYHHKLPKITFSAYLKCKVQQFAVRNTTDILMIVDARYCDDETNKVNTNHEGLEDAQRAVGACYYTTTMMTANDDPKQKLNIEIKTTR